MKVREVMSAIVLPFVVAVLLTVVLWSAASAAHTKELTTGTRQVLCLGILGNTANTARDDAVLVERCAEVGVYRESYGPTVTP